MSFFHAGMAGCRRLLLSTNFVVVDSIHCKSVPVRHLSRKGDSKVKYRVGLAGVTVGLLMGTGYSIHQLNRPRLHIVNEETVVAPVDRVPDVVPSRKVRHADDRSGLNLTLYQYQNCPFCCKVRTFLDYYGISYDVVEVDPVLRQTIKWSTYKKVPILVARLSEGYHQPLNDSSMIISSLATFVRGKRNLREIVECYPNITFVDEDGIRRSEIMNKYFLVSGESEQPVESSEERKWRKWTDEVFVHVLSPNVYRTRREALDAFNWFADEGDWQGNFPPWERHLIILVGSTAMYLIAKRLKKKYNLKDDVRESLYDECNYWMKGIRAKGSKFMGGPSPNLADLAVYGVLSSIEGCEAFRDVLTHTNISEWYYSMKESVTRHEGARFM